MTKRNLRTKASNTTWRQSAGLHKFEWLLSQNWSGLVVSALPLCTGLIILAIAAISQPLEIFATLLTALGYILLTTGLLLALAAALQILLTLLHLRKYPPLGALYDVGGYKLHILAEGAGDATILWIPGSHDQGLALYHLHNAMKEEARSILFDRAGSGRSDIGPFPRTLPQEAEELHQLLQAADETGPFIIAAHSLGGLLAQSFADRYPEMVRGLVLLDSSCPDATIYTQNFSENKVPGAGLGRWFLSAFGFAWLIIALMRGDRRRWLDVYDKNIQPHIAFGNCQPKLTIGFRSALRVISEFPFDLVKGAGALGNLPIYAVLPPISEKDQIDQATPMLPNFTAKQIANFIRLRIDAQHQTARLSSRGKILYSPEGTTHGFPFEAPEFTLDMVRNMISQTSTSLELNDPETFASYGSFDWLQAGLEESIQKNKVPGASIAILFDGEIHEAAAGVISAVSKVPTTPDTLFHIGSISKVFTATQVMQLADKGLVDLDTPYKHYVPQFTLKNPSAAEAITIRHLLTHTSGIPGDLFEDTGAGDDCLEKYVEACGKLSPIFEPGERFSYCNAGYNLLGYLVERLVGTTWESALATQLMIPTGARDWAVTAEGERPFRSAVGHFTDYETGELRPMPLAPRAMGPCGSHLAVSMRELIRFAELHLDLGQSKSGTQILNQQTALKMRTQEVDLSFNSRVCGWGLGWMLFNLGGNSLIGHDGGTAGMTTQLRIWPERRMAIAVTSNGGNGGGVFRDCADRILSEMGAPLPAPAKADETCELDLNLYVGTFRRFGMEIKTSLKDGKLCALVSPKDGEVNFPEPTWIDFRPVTSECFVAMLPDPMPPMEVYFVASDTNGRPQYLYNLERALKRQD